MAPIIDYGKYPVLGVCISAVNYAYCVQRIIDAAQRRTPFSVTALAVHGVMTGFLDPVHQRRLNGFDLAVPDGQPLRWALKWMHRIALPNRVRGTNLTLQILRACEEQKISVYFYGSTLQTVIQLVDNLHQTFPTLHIAGYEPSRFRRLSQAEKHDAIARITQSGASLVFVGLGCPRQEVWVYEYVKHLRMPLVAVGAVFDFRAKMQEAPYWMQENGLEWVYRLWREPKRLWKRYIFLNPLFLAFLLLERFSIYTRPILLPDGKEPEESYG